MLKKIFMGLGVVFVCLVGVLAFFLFKMNHALEKNKTACFEISNQFMECFLKQDPIDCKSKFIAKKHHDKFPDQQIINFAEYVKSKLGKRGASGPIDESWNVTNTENVNSPTVTTISFKTRTMYQNDIHAGEEFVVHIENEKLSIQSLRVNSDRLLKK